MDKISAQRSLGISRNISNTELIDIYNRKRAGLIAKKFSGEDVSAEIQEIEDAYRFLADEFNKDEPVENNSLVSIKNNQTQPEVVINAPWIQTTLNNTPNKPCPNCGEMIPSQMITCDICHVQIARPCPSCGNIIALDDRVCSRCGIIIQEFDRKRFSNTLSVEQKISEERMQIYNEVQENEKLNKEFIVKGSIIWVVIILILIFFCFLAYTLYKQYFFS